MPKIMRASVPSSARWSHLLVGAAVGAFVSWLVLRPRASEGPRWELLSRAFDETRAGLRAARQRLRSPLESDLDAIAARLHAEPGTRDFRVRSLGGGSSS